MKTKVLLIDTLSTLRVEKGFISPAPAIAQMTGFLEQEGIPFEVVFAIPEDDGQINILQNNKVVSDQFSTKLTCFSPDVVAFFTDAELIHLGFSVREAAEKVLPEAVYCIGSLAANALPDYFIERGFDYICGQDLFASFCGLVKQIDAGRQPEKGIVAIPDPSKDLDHFPLISNKFFAEMTPQWAFASGHIEYFGIVMGALGCTGGCTHCPNSSFWGTRWRAMSADRMVEEIAFQKKLLDVNTFYLGDINSNPNAGNSTHADRVSAEASNRFRRLDALLTQQSLNIRLFTTIRPDTLVFMAEQAPDVLDIFSRRIFNFFIGLESFSDRVLAGINKKLTRDIIRKAVKILDHRNIPMVASFMVGSPNETEETLKETEDFIMNELPPSTLPLLNIMTPFPGTRHYDEMHKTGDLIEKDLSMYNAQHLVFKHPVFKEGEIQARIQQFYNRFFSERFTG
jgi:radical SAM superfamily enzyme YgiQ (UPF0313 family)